jgi:phosphotransferase system IIA component
LERREPKVKEIIIPSIHISFFKAAFMVYSKDTMNDPTQSLATMGINTLKQDGSKVKSCSKKGKVVEEEELLPQLTVHTIEETSAKAFMQKLTNGKKFQNYVTQEAPIVFK